MAVNELRRWPRQLPRGGLHDAAVVLLLLRILGQVVPSHSGLCCFRLVRWVWRACLTNKQPDHGEICLVCLSICVCVCVRACMCRPSRPFARRGDRGQMRGDSNGSDTWGEMRLVPECDATQRNVPKGKLERRLRARLCANLRGARHLRREGEQAQAMNGRERDGE